MKKLLLILAVISFALSIAYFNWVYWTSGEIGWWQIYPIIFGIVLLLIRKNLDKLISDFHRGFSDGMSSE